MEEGKRKWGEDGDHKAISISDYKTHAPRRGRRRPASRDRCCIYNIFRLFTWFLITLNWAPVPWLNRKRTYNKTHRLCSRTQKLSVNCRSRRRGWLYTVSLARAVDENQRKKPEVRRRRWLSAGVATEMPKTRPHLASTRVHVRKALAQYVGVGVCYLEEIMWGTQKCYWICFLKMLLMTLGQPSKTMVLPQKLA